MRRQVEVARHVGFEFGKGLRGRHLGQGLSVWGWHISLRGD
jgi:hypothetical protein